MTTSTTTLSLPSLSRTVPTNPPMNYEYILPAIKLTTIDHKKHTSQLLLFLPSVREAMEAQGISKRRRKKHSRCSSMNYVSFSAILPSDVRGVFTNSICAVKHSVDPFADFRASIVKMIREVGVRDWEEMEELVYCYVVLNSSDLHGLIGDAFISLCSCSS